MMCHCTAYVLKPLYKVATVLRHFVSMKGCLLGSPVGAADLNTILTCNFDFIGGKANLIRPPSLTLGLGAGLMQSSSQSQT